jgi:hypothetical protein
MARKIKIDAASIERYRASARERRMYGGKTVTVFYVWRVVDGVPESGSLKVTGYGRTPGERKTFAKKAAAEIWEGQQS